MSLDIGCGNRSLLFKLLSCRHHLAKTLLGKGLRLEPRDLGDAFDLWVRDARFRKTYGDIFQHRGQIPQDAINLGFEKALEYAAQGKPKTLSTLVQNAVYTRDARIDHVAKRYMAPKVNGACAKPKRKLVDYLLSLELDPAWEHPHGGGWVYCIVEHFTRAPSYSEEEATSDVRHFIDRGASVSLVNNETGLDSVQMLEQWMSLRMQRKGLLLLCSLRQSRIVELEKRAVDLESRLPLPMSEIEY